MTDYQTAVSQRESQTRTVAELCPHCGNEIEMRWNTDERGYQAFCPVCGNRLMLCDECRHTDGIGGCDYDSKSDTCQFNRRDQDSHNRIVVVIENGVAANVYGFSPDTTVEIMEMDTDDALWEKENAKAREALLADVSAGKLVELL